MAQEPRFDVEDIQRLFRALVPSGSPDPFGRIEQMLLETARAALEEGKLTDEYRAKLDAELASIKTRTFGILILQIFKTIKFFLGILPSGRLMLVLLAGVGLLIALSEDGELSLGSIREAAASTGLARFIDDVMAELRKFTDELAVQTSSLANATSEMFVFLSGRLDGTMESLTIVANNLEPGLYQGEGGLATAMQRQAQEIDRIVSGLFPAANAAANGADLLGPALRGIDDRIRKIPDLALRLVTFR